MLLSNRFVISALILLITGMGSTRGDEGMWPLSEVQDLDLEKYGLQLDLTEIYNPEGISLLDGICKVSGCSGTFVSEYGLILTNHHCAFRAIQNASTPVNNFLEKGFTAENMAAEIPAAGYTVRITESYRDVSDEVLSVISADMSPLERTKATEKKRKEIIIKAEHENPGKRIEVSEMFLGKTYVLFLYTYLKDIRLVYAPPLAIGNFGGEVDNWMWPRHTGDFSFMRAYVAPDGSPAEYSLENIPFTPKKVIKLAPEGVVEGDFVFIMGYPGKTYRHRTSYFLEYEEEFRMPYVVDLYQWQIDIMDQMGKNDPEIELKLTSRIKSLSNVMKNYRGKFIGLKRLKLVEEKRKEENALQEFISANQLLNAKHGSLFSQIEKIYKDKRTSGPRDQLLYFLIRSSSMMNYAYLLYESSIEMQKPDSDRENAFMNHNEDQTLNRIMISMENFYEPADKAILKDLLLRAAALPQNDQISALSGIIEQKDINSSINGFIKTIYRESRLVNPELYTKLWGKTTAEIEAIEEPFIKIAAELYPVYQEWKENDKIRKGKLDELLSKLVDIKKEFQGKNLIPDANGTLRLTFGNIKGYSPSDATWFHPVTTLDGVIQKNTGVKPFNTPQRLIELYNKRDFGTYRTHGFTSVPTCILYDMDTTGGNSGSPVLNAKGEMVGINFDRAFGATINDFKWSEDYSRSIGVDIRYVLWVTDKFSNAQHIIRELGLR